MTLISALIAVLILVVVGSLAYWIITKFLPDPVKMVALAITGVLLLIFLLAIFFPGVGDYRVWGR